MYWRWYWTVRTINQIYIQDFMRLFHTILIYWECVRIHTIIFIQTPGALTHTHTPTASLFLWFHSLSWILFLRFLFLSFFSSPQTHKHFCLFSNTLTNTHTHNCTHTLCIVLLLFIFLVNPSLKDFPKTKQ